VQKRIIIPWTVAEDYPVGRQVLALTPQLSATPLNLVDWTGIDNILLGNEKSGLPQDVIDASTAAHIPALGAWHSLTIEQSLSIALWDWYLWECRARGCRP
jgi:tRNA G18 (ribose-2'-O)-methylase SpoU